MLLRQTCLQQGCFLWSEEVVGAGLVGLVIRERLRAQQHRVSAILEGLQHVGVAPEQYALRLQRPQ